MMRRILATLALATLTGAAACGDSTSPDSVAGTYVLTTIDGHAPPATLFEVSGDKLEATGGSVTLAADHSYDAVLALRETTTAGVESFNGTGHGTYRTSGSTISMTNAEDGSVQEGTLSGGTLTLTAEDGTTLVFKR